MSLNRKLTSEQHFELFEYARSTLLENPRCSTIMRWVRDHNYQLENFFFAYTLVKYGKYDKKTYQDVLRAFEGKQKIELEENYKQGFHGHRLLSYAGSQLYQSIVREIEQNPKIKF